MSSSRRLPDAATIPVYDERQQPTQTGCSVILTEGAKNDKGSFWKQEVWFPRSAWERTAPRRSCVADRLIRRIQDAARIAAHSRFTRVSARHSSATRSVAKQCVPTWSVGTRGTSSAFWGMWLRPQSRRSLRSRDAGASRSSGDRLKLRILLDQRLCRC